ncbi:zinc finger MYM-type protein 1-like [Rhopalosiphum padi]|uniref:zinc finger MYM-type protein 1-like n=1 Tax=Rhopalosiphum padi TaxID=40932 RepID=UPI00298EB097|nr:zinc finger MYM-type protein 1-like [Rhopalosiphum padi]
MKKSLGGAAKARERKKLKLEQVAHNCSQNISSMFNAITKKSSKLEPVEPQGSKFTQPSPNSQLQPDEDHQEYLVDDPNPVQLPSSILQGPENPKDISLTKSDKLVQPEMIFPAINGRRFSCKFYEKYNWIEYSVSNDALFCFPCRHFAANLSASGQTTAQKCFVNYGSKCKNWKEITKCLAKHSRYERHIISTQRWCDYQLVQTNSNHSVANQLINFRQQNINENRNHVHFLLKAALYLSKQGLAFRGHIESVSSKNKGNFIEILEMFVSDEMKLRLQSRYGHYTSPSYQNDFIQIIATLTRQHILGSINKFGFYTIMVDETKDLSKKEQMSFLLRFVDNDFNICEKSIGCYHMKNSNAESLANEIFKILSTNKLDKMNCIGQCYDGASVMSGEFSGVQERIRSEVPHAIYIHCYAHRLNLCLVQTLQNIPYIKRLIDTRWAYWYTSIKKINMRFSELLEVLSVLSNEGDQTARAIGILNEMSTLPFILTSLSMEALLQTVHCASLGLQNSNVIQSVAVNLINSTKESIKQMHNDTFWENINNSAKLIAEKNGIAIENSRRNRRPLTLNKNLNDFFVQSTIGHNSKRCIDTDENLQSNNPKYLFYTAIDRFVNELSQRFSDCNNAIVLTCSVFLSSSPNYFNHNCSFLNTFLKHYQHFNINSLLLESEFQSAKALIQNSNTNQKTLKIITILLTLPVSTASNERFFSSLKLVKTHLRLTMGDERLSDLLVIAVEKETASLINLNQAVDMFGAMKTRRYPVTA